MSPAARQVGNLTLFSAGYFVAVLAGHFLSFPALDFATFWPAAGVFLAALATSPRQRWWQILLLGSAINFATEVVIFRQSWTLSLIFMAANSLEALVGGLLLQCDGRKVFQFAKMRDVLLVAALSLASPLLGAAIGAWGLANRSPDADFARIFQLWWQADSIGILMIAPVQIAYTARWLQLEPRPPFIGWGRVVEAVALFAGLNLVTWLAFGPLAKSQVWNLIGLLYLVPALAWAGLRFCRLGATIASCNTLLIIIFHTTRGDGLFAAASPAPEMQAMSLQALALVTMLTPLLFATAIDAQRAAEDKLRANLSILQAVLDNTTDLIYIKDLTGRYLLVNGACADTVGRSVTDIVGRRDQEVLDPERRDIVRQRDQLVFAADRALTFEETMTIHGRKVTFLTTRSPYRNAAGKVVGLVGLSRDITQRIEQVEALAASERRYRTLVTSSNIGIFETDCNGLTLYLNPRWTELTGRSPESGAGTGWIDCLHPADRESVSAAFDSALRAGSSFAMEYRYLTPSGQINWVYGTAQPIRDEQGVITGYLGNVIDISNQKQALDDLRASEERFRRMADSAPVLIWTTTLGGRISYCNRSWWQFTGRELEAELGHGWLDCVHPEDRELCLAAYAEAEAERKEMCLEYRLRRQDGEYRWMHHAGAPKLSGGGECSGFVGSSFDVTDQRRATELLLRAKEELERHVAERTAALQHANNQLQQLLVEQARSEERLQQQQTHLAHVSRLSVMGEMAAGLAHELNQPLFAIQNYTAGILRRWSGPADCRPELREVIGQIAEESTRAAVIIRRVREFAGKQIRERESLPLNLVISEVQQLLASDLRKQQVDVRLNLAEHLPTVHIDHVQIQQVLVNLVRNALESMEVLSPSQRQLTISTHLAQGEVHCLVQDSGPGFTADIRQRLFEPFFTTKREGLGMGLSISRSIIEAHGGVLQAEDLDTGAAFHFSLPLLEEQADDGRIDFADRVFGG